MNALLLRKFLSWLCVASMMTLADACSTSAPPTTTTPAATTPTTTAAITTATTAAAACTFACPDGAAGLAIEGATDDAAGTCTMEPGTAAVIPIDVAMTDAQGCPGTVFIQGAALQCFGTVDFNCDDGQLDVNPTDGPFRGVDSALTLECSTSGALMGIMVNENGIITFSGIETILCA